MMNVDDAYIGNFTRRLYRFMNSGNHLRFEKMRTEAGQIHFPLDGPIEEYEVMIKLDFRDDIFATFIHEFLHYEHPDWGESKIEEAEKSIINRISQRRAKNIMKKLMSVLRG